MGALLSIPLRWAAALLEYLSKFAVVLAAITGEPLADAGRRVTALLRRNLLETFVSGGASTPARSGGMGGLSGVSSPAQLLHRCGSCCPSCPRRGFCSSLRPACPSASQAATIWLAPWVVGCTSVLVAVLYGAANAGAFALFAAWHGASVGSDMLKGVGVVSGLVCLPVCAFLGGLLLK